jgi:group I intron endonuclease
MNISGVPKFYADMPKYLEVPEAPVPDKNDFTGDEGVIYCVTNTKNGKRYIGQALSYELDGRRRGSNKRWIEHLSDARSGKLCCPYLENAINLYGPKLFEIMDIFVGDLVELDYYEQHFIAEYDTLAPDGYNLTTGGGNGRRASEATRRLMSMSRTGKTHRPETKQKISQALKGKKKTAIHNKHNSESHIGLVRTPEAREKTSINCKGKNMKPENADILNEALGNLGMKHLPMHVHMSVSRLEVVTIKVQHHPTLPIKTFGRQKMSTEDKILLAIEYLASAE